MTQIEWLRPLRVYTTQIHAALHASKALHRAKELPLRVWVLLQEFKSFYTKTID